MNLPDFQEEQALWQKGYEMVIGVDEVGRGCFAGPIVAGAVAFAKETNINGVHIDDSKRMKPRQREKSADWICTNAIAYGIGEIGVNIINKMGMKRATDMAFRMALIQATKRVSQKIRFVLIDAFYIPYVAGLARKNQKAIVDGDQKSLSIAAASIIAKVYRDALMKRLSKKHPSYQWGRNKGYGTHDHQEAIKKNGLTKLHRVMFVETFLRTKGLAF